ncbi:PAS domain S-box protein [Lacipirellula sp.]|uniref:sensor histidine kinase n=1 Tax=Lacipirellula sp. TaxID=2691419 RepID=UPI003D0F8DFD
MTDSHATQPPSPGDIERQFREVNEALLLSSLRQHELTEQAQESEARYRALFETSPMAVLVCDREGVIQEYNACAVQLWGREPVRGLEKHCGSTRMWHPDGSPLPHECSPIIAVLESGISSHNVEFVMERPDGSRIPVIVDVAATTNLQGQVTGAITAFLDISDRKYAEESLRVANEHLERRVSERTAELHQANVALREEIEERKQVEKSRQQLLHALVTAQEEERRRISRELHDQMGQLIVGLMLGLKSIDDASSEKTIGKRLQTLQDIANQIGSEIHELAFRLRPTALDDLGLEATLTNYIENWSESTEIMVDFHSRGMDCNRLPSTVETALYRIAQECLTNVLKHAHASRVSVILECDEDITTLVIEDNGVGFDADAATSGVRKLGILGMHERLAAIQGHMQIESTVGQGTTMIARIPVA